VEPGAEPVSVPSRPLAQRREALELIAARAQPQLNRGPNGLRRMNRRRTGATVALRLAGPTVVVGLLMERSDPLHCHLVSEVGVHWRLLVRRGTLTSVRRLPVT